MRGNEVVQGGELIISAGIRDAVTESWISGMVQAYDSQCLTAAFSLRMPSSLPAGFRLCYGGEGAILLRLVSSLVDQDGSPSHPGNPQPCA